MPPASLSASWESEAVRIARPGCAQELSNISHSSKTTWMPAPALHQKHWGSASRLACDVGDISLDWNTAQWGLNLVRGQREPEGRRPGGLTSTMQLAMGAQSAIASGTVNRDPCGIAPGWCVRQAELWVWRQVHWQRIMQSWRFSTKTKEGTLTAEKMSCL